MKRKNEKAIKFRRKNYKKIISKMKFARKKVHKNKKKLRMIFKKKTKKIGFRKMCFFFHNCAFNPRPISPSGEFESVLSCGISGFHNIAKN